jgi:hypothetical protein
VLLGRREILMNLNKYQNDGWGLSLSEFVILTQVISQNAKKNKANAESYNIVEFGSGFSTQFFVDFAIESKIDLTITSFDNSEEWCFKPDGDYPFLQLHLRQLLECDDESYKKMFEVKTYDPDLMKVRIEAPTTRQKNCFYEFQENDLDQQYDLMILDGPNGNGRNFAFLHLKDKMKIGSYILVDDYSHYDFVETMNQFFVTKAKALCNTTGFPAWYTGGCFALFEVIDYK